MATTRADVMYLARAYSQVPSSVIGDTLAYKVMDECEKWMYGEAARRAPSLMMTTATVTYPASTSFIVPTASIYRLVSVGVKADAGGRYTLVQQLGNIEFNELELSEQHACSGGPFKFHWNGTNLYLRPMPTSEITLLLYYVPSLTTGTTASAAIFAGNAMMSTFLELLANKVALRLRAMTGRDASVLMATVADQEKAFLEQVQKLQDAEPAHVARTESYLTGSGAGSSYTGSDPY